MTMPDDPPAPPRFARPGLCAHLGARAAGQPCGGPLFACTLHGDLTAHLRPCAGAARCCQTCPDYARRPPADRQPAGGA